jgi:hypothetical protein
MKMVMKRKRKKKMNMWMRKEKMLKEGAGSSCICFDVHIEMTEVTLHLAVV